MNFYSLENSKNTLRYHSNPLNFVDFRNFSNRFHFSNTARKLLTKLWLSRKDSFLKKKKKKRDSLSNIIFSIALLKATNKMERIDYIEYSRFLSIIRRSRVDLAGLILDQPGGETSLGAAWHANAADDLRNPRASPGHSSTRKPATYDAPDPWTQALYFWRKRDPRYDTSRSVGIGNVSLKRFFKENRIIVFTKVNNCKIKLHGNKFVFIFAMIL